MRCDRLGMRERGVLLQLSRAREVVAVCHAGVVTVRKSGLKLQTLKIEYCKMKVGIFFSG